MTDMTLPPMEPLLASEDGDDEDDGLGGSIASSSTSLASSIMRYREENGRTYHAFRAGSMPFLASSPTFFSPLFHDADGLCVEDMSCRMTRYAIRDAPRPYTRGSRRIRGADGADSSDLQHHLCTLTLKGKLFTCPAGRDSPLDRVLDAGTGTGIWAMDFGTTRLGSLFVGCHR
ncbi:hypothetical protein CDD80_1370 [Ophiocordyceps camponoti-rufipedis]|uniref:Methyltransferase domain-containing protein n=1 Tax=Ophiocordyceps camponoti-rufipedis TaxID=2004952 RepID=A0A2C5Y4S2_9HYPO|nr:hypothetical protein CDD80_1370 [Ophiocordyceps camponoti-rufipedis]